MYQVYQPSLMIFLRVLVELFSLKWVFCHWIAVLKMLQESYSGFFEIILMNLVRK